MNDPTTPFQDKLAERLLARAAKLREEGEYLATVSAVFRPRRARRERQADQAGSNGAARPADAD